MCYDNCVYDLCGGTSYDRKDGKMTTDLKEYTNFIRGVCALRKWKKDWLQGGCYIHLEVSELIESFRGKGDPLEELGDVLFTLLAVADYYNINPSAAIECSIEKHSKLLRQDGLI
jgi:hypothetical protein